ncbi:MAG: hypothetical protein TYPL_2080 [Candidatus Tyloplasma litorale]|nr:MAG: hypothetical protein TYPL_2080 [Mycoplasmatales bacterium]
MNNTKEININQNTIQQNIEEDRGTHKFDEGKVLSILLKTALPIVILMLFNSAYAFVDSLMSSTYVNYGTITDSSGHDVILNGGTSIGLIFPLMNILVAFEIISAVGIGLAYTQSISQKKYAEARQRHNESMTMTIFIGLIILLVIIIIGIPYLLTVSGNWQEKHWADKTHEMIWDGYFYMVILGISFIPMQLQQTYVRVLRAEGKGDIAAIIPIFTLPINILFDWIFMHHFQWGLKGAGLATLIASTSGLVMMWAYVIYKGKSDALVIKFELPKMRLHREIALVIFIFATGSFFRRIFDSITLITLTSYIGNLNVHDDLSQVANWTGSWTVITRCINMGIMLALGVAQAMSMLISYYVSSNQNEKLSDTLKYGIISMAFCSLFTFILLFSLQDVLFSAYSDIKYGFAWFNEISIAFILSLIYSIPLSLQPAAVMFYAGMKKPKLTLLHSLLFNGLLLLFASLGLVINLQTGAPLALFGSLTIGSIIAFIIVMSIFRNRYVNLVKIKL